MTEALAADPAGLGAVTMAEVFASEKAIALSSGSSEIAISPTPETVSSGSYPLSKFLYVYVNKDRRKGLEPMLRAFLTFAISPEGQRAVAAAGQAPLSPDIQALNALKVTDRVEIPTAVRR